LIKGIFKIREFHIQLLGARRFLFNPFYELFQTRSGSLQVGGRQVTGLSELIFAVPKKKLRNPCKAPLLDKASLVRGTLNWRSTKEINLGSLANCLT
jgi:hypothetical protein